MLGGPKVNQDRAFVLAADHEVLRLDVTVENVRRVNPRETVQ